MQFFFYFSELFNFIFPVENKKQKTLKSILSARDELRTEISDLKVCG